MILEIVTFEGIVPERRVSKTKKMMMREQMDFTAGTNDNVVELRMSHERHSKDSRRTKK